MGIACDKITLWIHTTKPACVIVLFAESAFVINTDTHSTTNVPERVSRRGCVSSMHAATWIKASYTQQSRFRALLVVQTSVCSVLYYHDGLSRPSKRSSYFLTAYAVISENTGHVCKRNVAPLTTN
jgi:hypothetical protein